MQFSENPGLIRFVLLNLVGKSGRSSEWKFELPAAGVRLPFLGGHKAVVRPDPIPNSAVKHSLADGSSPIGSARVGSRQFFNKNPEMILRVFCLLSRFRNAIRAWAVSA